MNREQQRAMQLAGTVSVPQKFPQMAIISFVMNVTDGGKVDVSLGYVAVDHVINAKLRIRRSFRASDVSAVFLPRSSDSVDLQNGEWFLGGEIAESLPAALENRGGAARGIAYVPEQAATLMQVEVGMTAAESVDYYPPLPDDRSVDHYAMAGSGVKGGRPDLSATAAGATAFCSAGFAVADSSSAGSGETGFCSAGVAARGDEGQKPKKERKEEQGKKQAKARGKKQEKKNKKKDKKRKKQLAALDPRSRIIW